MTETNRLFSLRTDEGVRSVFLVAEGPKYTSLIWADDRKPGVRINKIPNRDMRHAVPLFYRGEAYPVARAKRHFRRMGRSLGITKSARRALRA